MPKAESVRTPQGVDDVCDTHASSTWARHHTVQGNKRKVRELAATLMTIVTGGGQPVVMMLDDLADLPWSGQVGGEPADHHHALHRRRAG